MLKGHDLYICSRNRFSTVNFRQENAPSKNQFLFDRHLLLYLRKITINSIISRFLEEALTSYIFNNIKKRILNVNHLTNQNKIILKEQKLIHFSIF